ncbi:KR domain-containing protein [Rhodococcus sp. AD45-ID]|uniref:SDR family NAD(P)-dependent oxidoreductase n=1 Tax=unclassified Rhodococcus (in: high G+C Gram-positive bacteria) TaxID=192944 RepID=UPI0005D3C4E4|nr:MULTISPECIES: SDR family oxidoreductase [unclassified Rhodococcus (in: high G+C Gram-positive bacteria)]KJF20550.1 3-oxoacyl-(acyl-carrier-protein) reductase FabG [Rhodococcus sp. AD45]PSR38164.1 KR domain-containing protein [Rhodococcus sp. AD45-ID]
MDLRLSGKRAIVAGGSKGIGLAIARGLAEEGVDLAILARTEQSVTDTARELASEFGIRAIGVAADTRDDDAIQAAVREVVATLGGVDILVNSAATPWSAGRPTDFWSTTDDVVRGEVEVKVLGYLRTARAVAPHMVAQGWGRIINISGLGARTATSIAHTVRNVSVSALTKNLADELGPSGINVTVVHPGVTRTERLKARIEGEMNLTGQSLAEVEAGIATNSIRKIVDAAEVADVVTFLASPRSVAITGDAVAVGGGIPGPVYY